MKEGRFAQTIISELEKKLPNSINVSVAGGKYIGVSDKTKKVNFILIKSNDRLETFETVMKSLKGIKVSFEKKYYPSDSSFSALSITNYKKIGPKESEIRILFKFLDGKDTKNYYIWNDLLKNHVFTQKSDLERKPTNNYENDVIKTINSKIQELGNGLPVKLKILNKTFENVAGIVGGKHQAKADFVIVNCDAEEIGFLSYKAGETSLDFQQYSGISETRSGLSNRPEVKQFTKDILENRTLFDDYKRIYRKIEKPGLKKLAVFGKRSSSGRSGHESVDFFVQGTPRISKRGDAIRLSFSARVVRKNDLNGLGGKYEPVLGARKGESSRVITSSGQPSLRGVRGGVWTLGYMQQYPTKTKEI
jgi:hypothetical protein